MLHSRKPTLPAADSINGLLLENPDTFTLGCNEAAHDLNLNSSVAANAKKGGEPAMEVVIEVDENQETIKTTLYRYVILVLFSAFGFINQMQYVAFATVVRQAEEYFGVSALEVNVLSLIIPVVYVIGVIPGCYVYNQVGLRYGIVLGAGANAIAATLKLVSVWFPQYVFLVIAQLFVAIGQILFLSLPTLVAGVWFSASERTLATAVASLCGFAGMAAGMFYPPYTVSLPDNNTSSQWGIYMGTHFALSVGSFILILAAVREKPKYRPSYCAMEHGKLPLWGFFRKQFKNLNFVLFTISFGLVAGFLTGVAAVLVQVLEPFGIDDTTAGILAFSGIIGGSLNCAAVGFFVDRTRWYKRTIITLISLVVLLLLIAVALVGSVKNTSTVINALYVITPLLEFLVLPIVPVAMELAVELSFPSPETVSSTIVLGSMCLCSFIAMIIFSIILGDEPTVWCSFYVLLSTLIVCVISLIGFFFVRESLKRNEAEEADGEVKASSRATSPLSGSHQYEE